MKQVIVSEQKVIDEVKKAIVDTLGIEENSVTLQSSLMKDLGAESLDFLDINYRLEQTFGIKMARHTMLEHIEEMFGEDSAINKDGQLTEKAIQLLNARFGESTSGLSSGMDMDEVANIINVQSIAGAVMDILNTLPEKCSSCGASSWEGDDAGRIKCGACGEYAAFTNGDDLVKEWLKKVQEEKKIF
jgi:acyl carrier protein